MLTGHTDDLHGVVPHYAFKSFTGMAGIAVPLIDVQYVQCMVRVLGLWNQSYSIFATTPQMNA